MFHPKSSCYFDASILFLIEKHANLFHLTLVADMKSLGRLHHHHVCIILCADLAYSGHAITSEIVIQSRDWTRTDDSK